MLIESITIRNFMPYKGDQTVVFPRDSHRNVAVIFGGNMRGKTSLLNAIRWALYGKALGRHGRQIPRAAIVNVNAIADGDHSCSACLRFSDGGKEYEIRREIGPRDLVIRPKSDFDFEERVSLRVDGQLVPGADIERQIDRLLPEDISRFFLFDGESLQEYEMLIMGDSGEGDVIKEKIEQVLGVPALVNARIHLAALLADARREQTKAMKKEAGLVAIAREQETLQSEIAAKGEEVAKIEEMKQSCRDDLDRLEDYLRATEADQTLVGRRAELKGRLQALKDSRLDSAQHLRDELRGAWLDLVWPAIEKTRADLERSASEWKRISTEIERIRLSVRNYTVVIEKKICPTCGQDARHDSEIMAEEAIREAESRLAELERQLPSSDVSATDLLALRRLTGGSAGPVIRRLERRIRQISLDIASVKEEMRDLEVRVATLDTSEMTTKRNQHRLKSKQLWELESELKSLRSVIEELKRKEAVLSKLLSRSPVARNSRTNLRVEILEEMYGMFDSSINTLRDNLRRRVQEYASEAFLALTTDATYQGLKISETYGLNIIDAHGRIVRERSAGAEQIVALALIHGLNRTAGREAPIFMDTPFGRLDPKHRERVLSYLPTMAKQVALLVHEGEVRRDHDLVAINEHIGKIYEIDYVSSSESRVTEIRS